MSESPPDYAAILRAMFQGWCDKNNQPEDDEAHTKEEHEWFVPYTSTPEEAYLLSLFGYWSNDLLTVAANFGVTMEYDTEKGFYVADADPKPTDGEYYYSAGEMQWDDGRYLWQPGEWIKVEEETRSEDVPSILEGK